MQPMHNGMQSIHLAACEGQEAMVKMLVDEFHVMPEAATNVLKIILFKIVCTLYNYYRLVYILYILHA